MTNQDKNLSEKKKTIPRESGDRNTRKPPRVQHHQHGSCQRQASKRTKDCSQSSRVLCWRGVTLKGKDILKKSQLIHRWSVNTNPKISKLMSYTVENVWYVSISLKSLLGTSQQHQSIFFFCIFNSFICLKKISRSSVQTKLRKNIIYLDAIL